MRTAATVLVLVIAIQQTCGTAGRMKTAGVETADVGRPAVLSCETRRPTTFRGRRRSDGSSTYVRWYKQDGTTFKAVAALVRVAKGAGPRVFTTGGYGGRVSIGWSPTRTTLTLLRARMEDDGRYACEAFLGDVAVRMLTVLRVVGRTRDTRRRPPDTVTGLDPDVQAAAAIAAATVAAAEETAIDVSYMSWETLEPTNVMQISETPGPRNEGKVLFTACAAVFVLATTALLLAVVLWRAL